MEEILLKQLSIIAISIGIAYIVLKLLFKKSILMVVGVLMVSIVLIVSLLVRLESHGYLDKIIEYPIAVGITISALYIINRKVKKPLEKSIERLKNIYRKAKW